MKKTINENDFVRLVYEAYKHALNEAELTNTPSQYNQQIEWNVSEYRNLLQISFIINGLSPQSVDTKALSNDIFNCYINSIPQDKGIDTSRISNKINCQFHENALFVNIPIMTPSKLFTEEKKINTQSLDFYRLKATFQTLNRVLHVKIPASELKAAALEAQSYGMIKEKKMTIGNGKGSIEELYNTICNTIDDPQTQELLGRIQLLKEGAVVDHSFSVRNKLWVIAQAFQYDAANPTANQVGSISYLATPRQWGKMGRRVVDFQYPYFMKVAYGGRGNKSAERELLKNQGSDIINQGSFVGDKATNIKTNARLYGLRGYGTHTYFDVSATQAIGGGITDAYTETAAMKNNMTGELNDIAQDEINTRFGRTDDTDERTSNLNDKFGNSNYDNVPSLYLAICKTAGVQPSLNTEANPKMLTKESGKMISKLVADALNQFGENGGRIALPKHYVDLIPFGEILIRNLIRLPMDGAPSVKNYTDNKKIFSTLSTITQNIGRQILDNLDTTNTNLDEMLKRYDNLIVFDEWINHNIKTINENVQYFN